MTKVIIVGPAELHTFFTSAYTDWDTQIPVERIDDVWSGLQNGSLSQESSVVVFTDADMEEETDSLVTAVATFASEATVLVLFYDINNAATLKALVSNKQTELGMGHSEFFPINTGGDVGQEIYDAFIAYNNIQTTQAPPASDGVYSNITETEDEVSYQPTASNQIVNGRKRGLIVASTSSKGGSGKTTVGICTASTIYHASKIAADRGEREAPLNVCIVDMDIRDGQIGFILNQLSPTALNIFLANNKDENVIQDNLIFDERLGIHALLAPKRARTADFLSPEFYMHIIESLAYMFDVVVLDTSVNYTDDLLGKVVFPIADAIMFVTNLSVGSVYGMNRWMDEVTTPVSEGGPGISKSKIGIVVNQSAPNLGIDQDLLRHAAAGAELLVAIPLDSSGVIAASNHNRLSDIIQYHPDISPAYYSIVKQLLPNEALGDPLISGDGNSTKPSGPGQPPKPAPTRKPKRFGIF